MVSGIRFYCLTENCCECPFTPCLYIKVSICPVWGKKAVVRVGLTKTCVDNYPDKILKIEKHRSIEKCFLYNVGTRNFFLFSKVTMIFVPQTEIFFSYAPLPRVTLTIIDYGSGYIQ